MAVVKNFWLRDLSQKLGGAVLYQNKGETLIRQLAPAISNPRTSAQMTQRVKLSNLVTFYRASKSWMRNAFETKPANQSDYNAFVAANLGNNKVWLSKSLADAGACVVAPYQISRGSLPEIVQRTDESGIWTNLYVGDWAAGATATVASLTAALLNNNNGLAEGDQLSVIQYIQTTASDGTPNVICRAYEMILSLTNTAPVYDYLPEDVSESDDSEAPTLGLISDNYVGGAAFVLSRTQSGRILVSTSYVTLTYGNSVYPAMTTTAAQQAAVDSYGETTEVFLDSASANTANSTISVAAQILSITLGTDTVSSGGTMPEAVDDDLNSSLQLSAPITIPAGGVFVHLTRSYDGLMYNRPVTSAAGTTSTVEFVTDGDIQFPDRGSAYSVTVQVVDGSGNVLAAGTFAGSNRGGE